jgi:Uma2 family endonuclease
MSIAAPPQLHSPDPPSRRRFTRDEYYQMADMGLFEDERVELINGEIIQMAPQKSTHFCTIEAVVDILKKTLGPDFWVRAQGPLNLAADSAPEPDIAVTRGSRKTHKDHPSTALLVIEVSDTTLRFDRKEKASFYAKCGINDYWIINIRDRVLEVMREPRPDASAADGFSYGTIVVLQPNESVMPLAQPSVSISVSELFE